MSSNQFNFFKEKLTLQEEEKELKNMLEKLKDQHNRLKIEELALMSMMKMEKEKLEKEESTLNNKQSSSARGSVSNRHPLSESTVTTSSVLASEDASFINQQSLNLGVQQNEANAMDQEEEEDSDDDEAAAAETHQLMSFMEDF